MSFQVPVPTCVMPDVSARWLNFEVEYKHCTKTHCTEHAWLNKKPMKIRLLYHTYKNKRRRNWGTHNLWYFQSTHLEEITETWALFNCIEQLIKLHWLVHSGSYQWTQKEKKGKKKEQTRLQQALQVLASSYIFCYLPVFPAGKISSHQ